MADNDAVRTRRPHVVVVGGGFGGLSAIRKLGRADVDITLIDRHTYNTFQPLLYQVATAALNPGDITWFLRSIRSHNKNVHYVKGTVLKMDHDTQTIQLDGGQSVTYDYLIIATGVTTNFFGIPGADEYAMPLYRRSQALAVRDKMFERLEDAAINGQEDDLRIVVVGAGATGVETAGALAELRNNDMPVTYPELDPERVHISLVEMAPVVLGPFHPSLQRYAHKALEKRGVDLRLDTAVKEVRKDGVVVGDGEFLPAGIVIWASGITVHEVVQQWNVPQGRGGRIETGYDLRVRGSDRVFAVGDIALTPTPLPQLAQPAMQGGKHAAKTIRRLEAGHEAKPFVYHDKGTMATIGRSAAVVDIKFGPRLKGFIAWISWIALHIFYLLGNRNRLATMINLSARYLFWHRNHNAIVGETPPIIMRKPRRLGAKERPLD